jgi:hypothetical protein
VPLTSEAELAFVRSLGSRTSETLVIMPAADEPTLTRLRKGLRVELENLDDGESSPGRLARLQRHIFSEETISAISAPDGQVVVFSAPGEGRECVEIARRVGQARPPLSRRGYPWATPPPPFAARPARIFFPHTTLPEVIAISTRLRKVRGARRCTITANRCVGATRSPSSSRLPGDLHRPGLSQDGFVERTSMLWAAS